jgi:hypothetical protein
MSMVQTLIESTDDISRSRPGTRRLIWIRECPNLLADVEANFYTHTLIVVFSRWRIVGGFKSGGGRACQGARS